ncbi:MAG: cupin domain-containing protein [Rhodospirillales bacterium]|nr:MAG: cupin domain-containing protein [Rhodospirillales bacterium]
MTDVDADTLIRALKLAPHPEGGFYRETFRDDPADHARGALAVIHFLLPAGHRSAWHRLDAFEVWHFQAGCPLRLSLSADGRTVHTLELAAGPPAAARHHAVVLPRTWMSAVTLGAWSLVTCTTAPAFRFDGFELAPPGWQPGG